MSSMNSMNSQLRQDIVRGYDDDATEVDEEMDRQAQQRQWHALDSRINRARKKASPAQLQLAEQLTWDCQVMEMRISYDPYLRRIAPESRARLLDRVRELRRQLVLEILLSATAGQPTSPPTGDALYDVRRAQLLTMQETADAPGQLGFTSVSAVDQAHAPRRQWS